MDDDSPRALAFAATVWGCGVSAPQLEFGDDRHAPKALSDREKALLGGMIVRIGDTVYDGSVHHQLAGLRTRLEQGSQLTQ